MTRVSNNNFKTRSDNGILKNAIFTYEIIELTIDVPFFTAIITSQALLLNLTILVPLFKYFSLLARCAAVLK